MKTYVIKNIVKKVICWILLLQIINISVDPPDLNVRAYDTATSKKESSFDETESVYELIAEGVFDEKVPESDEDEMDTSSPSFELYFFNRSCSRLPALVFPLHHSPHYHNNFLSLHQEPHSPPPKIV